MHLITSAHTPHTSLSRLRQISAAVSLTCLLSALPASAYAAALGKLTVLSAIGQPLNAEVELLSVGPQEKQSLAVKLAPQQAFSQANVDYNPALGALRFAIEARGTGQVVHITSADGFNEPFVDALLELSGPNTPRAVREYSFLLDPPRGSKENAAQVAPAADVAESKAVQPKMVPKAESTPESKAESKAEPKAEPKAAAKVSVKPAPKSAEKSAAKTAKTAKAKPVPSEYKIKQGDSLSAIANRMRPAGVSLDQMLVAMYRANPDAFDGENMSRMRAGKILSIPDAATAAAVEQPQANAVVVAQAQDFNTYRNQLAGHVAGGSAKKAGAASQTASGKITAKIEERSTPAGEAKDKLQLSKGGAGDGMTSEDKIAADKAASDAASRIKDLEKNVGDLQKLLEIKNQNLAELNAKKADAAPAAAAATSAATPAAAATPATNAPAAATPAPDVTPAAVAPAETATTPVTPTTPAAPAASETPATDTPPAAPPKPVLAAPVPKPDFFEGWRDNPMLLPGGGLLALVLLAWAAYRARRKTAPGPFDPGAESAPEPSPVVPPVTPKEETVVAAPAAATVAAAPEPEPIVEAPVEAPPAPVAVTPAFEESIMADPLFASDETAALATAQNEAAEQQAKRDAEDALKIDLSRLEEPGAPAAAPVAPSHDMSKLGFDLELDQDQSKDLPLETGEALPDIDLAAELAAQSAAKSIGTMDQPRAEPKAVPVAAPAPAPEPRAILPSEIEGLDLDLSDPAEAQSEATAAAAAAAEEEDEDETSSFAKEINTKVDLAAAYQEIGDKDGARELLDEVVKSGNRRQVAKAQEMLEQLV
jgi:pilus assembly protein FimV